MSESVNSHNLWHRISATQEDIGVALATTLRFLSRQTGESLSRVKPIVACTNILEIADAICAIGEGVIRGPEGHDLYVEGKIDGHEFLAIVWRDQGNGNPRFSHGIITDVAESKGNQLIPSTIGEYQVEVTSDRNTIQTIFGALDAVFKEQKYARLNWWSRGDHGVSFKRLYLPSSDSKLPSELYPDLVGGPKKFISDYLESNESILLLCGEPGTGKTTLLRHMICDNKMSAHVCYDESLMNNDEIFQNFLLGSDGDILIIEDADTLLTSRERSGNTLMSRFLNVSDGLIKLPNKKIVFTTNISDFGRIDPALLRPGRCYGVLHTRPLNLEEAQAASRVCGFPCPTERREYTLADLFNQGRSGLNAIRRIGYAA